MTFTTETNLEKFIKLVGFYNIKNTHNGIIDFDSLMNDLKNTKEYKQILAEQRTIKQLKEEIVELKENQRTVQDVLNSEIVERLKKAIKYVKSNMKEYRTADVYYDFKDQYEILKSIFGKKS